MMKIDMIKPILLFICLFLLGIENTYSMDKRQGAEVDSIFLETNGSLYLVENYRVKENLDILKMAERRMEKHKYVSEGRFKWDITRGREVKISENIFVYITGEWRKDNEKIKTGKYELRRDLIGGGLFAVPKDEPLAPNDWEKVL